MFSSQLHQGKTRTFTRMPKCCSMSPNNKRKSTAYTDVYSKTRIRTFDKIIKELSIDTPRPPSFYITKARDRFLNSAKPLTPNSVRNKSFSPKRQIIKDSSTENQNQIVPDWLMDRPDFQLFYKTMNGPNKVAEISQISSNKTEQEKDALFVWLSGIRFFQKFSSKVIRETSEKLIREDFNIGDIVMKKGDSADCMYIIFSGKANVYLEEGSLHNIVIARDVIGEHALDTQKKRTATIIAQDSLVLFKLTKSDYDSILLNCRKQEKQKICKFLTTIQYFHNWAPLKIQHFSNFLFKKRYKQGSVIFDKSQESDVFFIIKKGTVAIQAHVELQLVNRWPTGVKSWKISEVNRKYLKTICTLTHGQYFGETDLINRDPRSYRALSESNVVCLTIEKDEFFDIFSAKDLDNLIKLSLVKIPHEEELEKMLETEIQEKEMHVRNKQDQALYKSILVDFENPECRDGFVDKKTRKMRAWIFNLKNRVRDDRSQLRKRVVNETKKEVEVHSLKKLKDYSFDRRK